MSETTCLICRYFRAQDAQLGRCVRYPPRVCGAPKSQDDAAEHTFWPVLTHDNLCGEWQSNGTAK